MIKDVVRYEPETGVFYWLPRPVSMFASCVNPEVAAKRWNARHAGKRALNTDHGNGYLSGFIWRRKVYAHRAAWECMIGEKPDCIDHIDGNRRNNSWGNLRSVKKSENAKNSARPSHNTSGFVGVSKIKGCDKWEAYIGDRDGRKRLGRYNCITAAAMARKAAEKRLGYHENHGRPNAHQR